MNHRSDPAACPTGENARLALRAAFENGSAYGLLAFDGERAVGWCAVDPVATQVGHDYFLHTPGGSDWMIHCLYVEESARGKGVSGALVEAAAALAKENMAERILGFPIPEGSAGKFPKDLAEFSGRLSTFRKLGFEPRERLDDFYQVVALQLSTWRVRTEPIVVRTLNSPGAQK